MRLMFKDHLGDINVSEILDFGYYSCFIWFTRVNEDDGYWKISGSSSDFLRFANNLLVYNFADISSFSDCVFVYYGEEDYNAN